MALKKTKKRKAPGPKTADAKDLKIKELEERVAYLTEKMERQLAEIEAATFSRKKRERDKKLYEWRMKKRGINA